MAKMEMMAPEQAKEAEDLARLKELDRRWWVRTTARAVAEGEVGDASERVMAIIRPAEPAAAGPAGGAA